VKLDTTDKVAIGAAAGFVWFGIVGPAMVSASSTALVAGYVVVSVVVGLVCIKKLRRKK
jgi:hypothetical protein